MGNLNLNKIGQAFAGVGKTVAAATKSKEFWIGAATVLPPAFGLTALAIKHYQAQLEEKEEAYKQALAKEAAVIKELNATVELDRERQERLLAYDTALKKDIANKTAEIQELKDTIAELKKASNE